MKKRRELDALVTGKNGSTSGGGSGGGALGRQTSKNGKHELLLNESGSSDVEEFSMPDKMNSRKHNRCATCSKCLSVWWAFLLIICIITIGGLAYLHFQLKWEVDELMNRLSQVETDNKDVPRQIGDLIARQEVINTYATNLETGEFGLKSVIKNFTLLSAQISTIELATNALSKSVASSSQLESLPQQFTDLSQSVATGGSNIQLLQDKVKFLEDSRADVRHQLDDFDAKIKTLQIEQLNKNVQTPPPATLAPPPPPGDVDDVLGAHLNNELIRISAELELVNLTLLNVLEEAKLRLIEHDQSISELRNYTTLLNTRLTFVELKRSKEDEATLTDARTNELINMAVNDQWSNFRNVTAEEHVTAMATMTKYVDDRFLVFQELSSNSTHQVLNLYEDVMKMTSTINQMSSSTDDKFKMINTSLNDMSLRLSAVELAVDKHPGGDPIDGSSISSSNLTNSKLNVGVSSGSNSSLPDEGKNPLVNVVEESSDSGTPGNNSPGRSGKVPEVPEMMADAMDSTASDVTTSESMIIDDLGGYSFLTKKKSPRKRSSHSRK